MQELIPGISALMMINFTKNKSWLAMWLLALFICSISCNLKISGRKGNHTTLDRHAKEYQISFITYNEDPESKVIYKYNEQGDIVMQIIGTDTMIFEYFPDKIRKVYMNTKHSWLSKIEYTTDSLGRITGNVQFDENHTEICRSVHSYNNVGFLLKTVQEVWPSGKHVGNEFKYHDGNMVEVQTFMIDGQRGARYVYEYYAGKPNELNLLVQQFSNDIFPNEKLGRRNRNLLKQIMNISSQGDTLSLVKYHYTVEESNRSLTLIQTDVLNGFETIIRYYFK